MHLRIGTRGSRLALAQTEIVCRMLAGEGIEVERVVIRTEGDEKTSIPLHEIGGYGLFVRAIDEAILEGRIDAAVHSMKDIPAKRPQGIETVAVLERDSPADFLVCEGNIDDVRSIGTSSIRRRAQLIRHFTDIEVRPLRGNLDTRVRRLREGKYDAIVVAEAGIRRMGYVLGGRRLPTRDFVPTPNQGIIAIVCRRDEDVMDLLSFMDHPATRIDAEKERAVMEEVGAGCHAPLGIYSDEGYLIAEALTPDGMRRVRMERRIESIREARECGGKFREEALEILEEAKAYMGGTK
ncbi:MAG: hydroxymethylbilane synthase [Methanomicrobiales archaeon]|nr:hydroxymethylbilane synthase [Methanomicrobiales archaeon]